MEPEKDRPEESNSPELPLHVQVAQAIGWKNFHPCEGTENLWIANDPDSHPEYVPRYDLEWSATGPLIELMKLAVEPCPKNPYPWMATRIGGGYIHHSYGETPLIAICRVLLLIDEYEQKKQKENQNGIQQA